MFEYIFVPVLWYTHTHITRHYVSDYSIRGTTARLPPVAVPGRTLHTDPSHSTELLQHDTSVVQKFAWSSVREAKESVTDMEFMYLNSITGDKDFISFYCK